jgi:hypothetical protein
MKKDKVIKQKEIFDSKFKNIDWILAGHLSNILVISNPDIININKLPKKISFGPPTFKTDHIFGITLPDKDRALITNLHLGAINRLLIADSFDILVESFCRACFIFCDSNNRDPYESDNYLTFTGKSLYSGKKESKFFSKNDKTVIEKWLYPLRNIIRHHNGVVPRGQSIKFDENVYGIHVNISLKEGSAAQIKGDINSAIQCKEIVRKIGAAAFDRLIENCI